MRIQLQCPAPCAVPMASLSPSSMDAVYPWDWFLSPPCVQPAGMAQIPPGQLEWKEAQGVLVSLAAGLVPRLLLKASLFQYKFPFGSSAFTGLRLQAGLR